MNETLFALIARCGADLHKGTVTFRVDAGPGEKYLKIRLTWQKGWRLGILERLALCSQTDLVCDILEEMLTTAKTMPMLDIQP